MVQLTTEQRVFIAITLRVTNILLNSFFMHKIYLRQAFMYFWVQQSAEAFKF